MKYFGYNSLIALLDIIKGNLSRLGNNIVPTFQNVYDYIFDLKNDFGTCNTAADIVNKIATISDRNINLVAGEKVKIKFTNINTAANPKISINNSALKYLKANDNTIQNLNWRAGSILYLEYDGTYWRILNLLPVIPYDIINELSNTEINLEQGTTFVKTISENTTFTIINAPINITITFNLILTNGGAYTITWPNSIKWNNGNAPTLTPSGVDILKFISIDGGVTWYGTIIVNNAI